MENSKKYNLFLFFSTISRNIIEVFSSIFLYKLGFSIKEILIYYLVLHLFGIIINYLSIVIGKKIGHKKVLIFSSLIFCYAFYYLSNMNNAFYSLIFFAFLLSLSTFSYHSMRHYYALNIIDNNSKRIGKLLISMYVAIIISSVISSYIINKIGFGVIVIIILITSLLGICFLFYIKEKDNSKKIEYNFKILKEKILFLILEQFKIIFLILQPLYLFIYVDNNIEYIGIYNSVISIACLICIYFFIKKIDQRKYFKILNILFCIVLIFKINVLNKYILLFIALFEGIGIKIFEVVSTNNLYKIKDAEINGYLILTEIIFCLTRVLIFMTFIFIKDIKIMLYLCIIGIFLASFVIYRKRVDIDNVK